MSSACREHLLLHTEMTTETQSQETQDVQKRFTFFELETAAAGKWPDIFEDLAPELALAQSNAPDHVPCPSHGGNNGYRLFEHYPKTGRGICNTCGPQKSGFETLAFVKNISFEEACQKVGDWLRMDFTAKERKARPPVVLRPRVEPAVAYRRISEVWKASKPLKGSAAEAYLIKRGIWKPNLPSSLRAHDGLVYVHGREQVFYGKFPCLLAPIRDKDNKIVSIHRIFLTPEGDKAPVPDAKKMMSPQAPFQGTAIKLFPAEGDTLGVAEGIETALAAHAVSRMPVWASVSAVLMEQVDIPAHIKRVVIWADLDRSQRGLQAAEALADRLEALGIQVEICMPQGPIPEGQKGVDWLDVMLTQGINGFPAKWRRWRPEMTAQAA